MSFANVSPMNLNGAGGQLLLDATSTPATSSLTLGDDGLAADGWSQVAGDGGFETTRFRGFSQLLLVGGDGSETIDQIGLDSATSLTNVFLLVETRMTFWAAGGDLSSDTIRVRSTPAGAAVSINTHGGDDLIQLFDAANTIDNLLAPVVATGGTGNDTLIVTDLGDVTATTCTHGDDD